MLDKPRGFKKNNAEQKPIAQSVLINLTSLHSSEKISNHIESWLQLWATIDIFSKSQSGECIFDLPHLLKGLLCLK